MRAGVLDASISRPRRSRLGQVLATLMPDESEVLALLALMLLNDSRRHARMRDHQLVLLDDQDRSLWNEQQVADGRSLLERATVQPGVGALRPPGGDRRPSHPSTA
jgi:predicted RNA polymerase sigma factor